MKFKDKRAKDAMVNIVLVESVGEICPQCKMKFKSVGDIRNRNPIYVGKFPNGEENPEGTLCCKNCFEEYEKKFKNMP